MSRFAIFTDFDKTIARTDLPSPHNLTVEEAYKLAVQEVCGQEALDHYLNLGGFQNRSPEEIASLIEGHRADLSPSELTDKLVEVKLRHLLDEVGIDEKGLVWPQPCKGFPGFWQALTRLSDEGIVFDLVVISSGHRQFIEKTFDLWRNHWCLDCPKTPIIVSDEDIRGKNYPPKPSLYPFALAHRQWLADQEHNSNVRKNIVYIGDDLERDVLMAVRAGVVGGLYQENCPFLNCPLTDQFIFGDWRFLADKLFQENESLREGKKTLSELLLGRPKGSLECREISHQERL